MSDARDPVPERRVVVPETLAGVRLDKVLHALLPDQSRSYLRELVKRRFVRIGTRVEHRPRHLCQTGAEIVVRLAPRRSDEAGPPPPEFRVLHHDDAILVISKPAGLAAHRNENELRATVADYAQRDFGLLPSLQGMNRPGIVHRLDKDTSGVMVLARTSEAFHGLRDQFAARTVAKEYRAIVFGELRFESQWIESSLDRHPVHTGRMTVVAEGGRESATFVESLERFGAFSFLRCVPKTGRTHQIRVHLTSIGHGIVGDRLYRSSRGRTVLPEGAPPVARHLLHALSLEIDHPTTGERMRFEAPIPGDFEAFLAWLRGVRP